MKKFDQINVIPFIDIMLVLLAIVLLTATFISQGKIKVNLPESSTATALNAEDVTVSITIDENNEIFFNDHKRDLTSIRDDLNKLDKNQQIILKIDQKTPFEHFVKIGDVLRELNLNNIALQTLDSKNAH